MQTFIRQATEFLPILAQGLWMTVLVTAGSLVLSTLLGLVWAMMRVSGIRALAMVAATIVNVIRGIPIIVQLFWIY
ncbi:ABC transporter permease subunit, partial [Enterobacter ludwigii]|uniref:ABC transporter permease subunit n=1 Tax=Enterobacter ludwigii TaxID=299767 RepID=UPI0013D65847